MATQAEKCLALAALHAQDSAWIIPNPWDVGSALDMQAAGFKAIATSSAAVAYTLGKGDGQISLAEKLDHCAAIAGATEIPVSVDFEDGFDDSPEEVAANVRRLGETGVAGCSVEDFSRTSQTVFDFDHAVERVAAAVQAAANIDTNFQLIARAENLLRKHADLDDTIKRLQAYEQAGAHVLYAPGIASLETLKQVADATQQPLNVLWPFFPGVSLEALGEAGANRLSLGSAIQIQQRAHLQQDLKSLASAGWGA